MVLEYQLFEVLGAKELYNIFSRRIS